MSTLPSECEQLLISGYVLGNLSPVEAMLFNEILAENPALKEQVMAMQEVLDSAYAPPEISPPNSLRDQVLAAANQSATLTSEVSQLPRFRPKLSWNKILGAIALGLIIVLGITNYRFWRTIQTAKVENPQVARRDYLLQGKDLPEDTVAKLVVNPAQLNGTLIAKNLPTLPPGKVYALWTVVDKNAPFTTDEKGAILTAVFQVNQSGNVSQEIIVPEPHFTGKAVSKIAITVEDKAAPQAHQGSVLMATGNISN